MTSRQRDRFRVDHVGFIFQQFNLVPYLSAAQNVLLPCRFSPRRAERAGEADGCSPAAHAEFLLDSIGIDRSLSRRPVTELSVGQQQRVAAARALIGRPELILADEPTSALDADAQQLFLDLLLEQCGASGAALLLVTHDQRLAKRFDRTISLHTINDPAV
jgi:putative ABC transport system ATP-binding protein